MVSLRTLARLYRAQLRARPLPELLALLGIAAGVALLFAVQVANKSVTGSFEQLTEGIVGSASLEVAARGPQGFDQELYRKVERLPDVEAAAPVVERRIAVRGPKGRRALTLFGFDDRLERLGGTLIESIARQRDVSNLGLYLTEPTANAIGVRPGRTVTVEVGERIRRLPLGGIAPENEIGSLIENPVAVAHLGLAQEIASMPERITRILVAPIPGRKKETESALKRISGDKLNVRPSDTEAKLLNDAAATNRQSSDLFGAISLVVGILLAYNAMLLTITARRRSVAGLHALGATNKTIVASLIFDALILGLAGSLLGILIGDLLSRFVLHEVPDYLSAAFAIGRQRIVEPETVLLSIAGGTLAAIAAAARPAVDLLKVGPLKSFSERGASAVKMRYSVANKGLLWGGITLSTLSIAFSLLLPETTLVMLVVLILGLVMILPALISYLLTLTLRIVRHTDSAAARISVGELVAAPTRAAALAAVGALAVFAILGITGSVSDVRRGIDRSAQNFFGNADLWVLPGKEENAFGTQPFNYRGAATRIGRVPSVESVRTYRGSFLDLSDRRLIVLALSPKERNLVSPSQIINGDFRVATHRIRQGGWAALTETLAKSRNIKVGQEFSLPTPSGNDRFRLAATITNYGWPSGVLVINSQDYAHIWKTQQASALEIDLAGGVMPAEGKTAVQQALGEGSALRVQTFPERRAESAATVRQGLTRLNQIADMVLITAVLAITAAMLGSVWQRRQRLLRLVSLGMEPGQLYRTIYFETGIILLLGCLIGASFGFILQALGGRWLHLTTAYPVPFEPAFGLALKILILVVALSVLATAIPIRFVFLKRRVPASSLE